MGRARYAVAATMSALLLAGCQSTPVENVSTHTSIAPPLGVTPTLAANPTQEQATAMEAAPELEPANIDVYVAMGDSYAAMGSASGDKADPSFCAKSKDNYPNELADMLGRDVEFIDATCQGSETKNIEGPREVPDEDLFIEPQIEELRSDADLVTLSLGGNDIGFAAIARCINAMGDGEDRDCAQEFALPVATSLAELPGRLSEVHRAIREKAPDATVVVTGYTPLISLQQECELTDQVGRAGVEWAVWLTAAINNIVKQTAEANGAVFVLPDDVEDHTTCASPRQRWVAVDGEETNSYPAHPTPNGQREIARTIARILP